MVNQKENVRAGTSIFALDNRPRATRAMMAKVRTGCITCKTLQNCELTTWILTITCLGKRRHVKCGEEKPDCRRCIKWRGRCDGYEDIAKTQRQTSQESHMSGRNMSESTSPPSSSVQSPWWYESLAGEIRKLISLPKDYSSPRGSNTPHTVSEQSWRDRTDGTYNSNPPDVFWRIKVPHLLRNNSSVWYANLAIHALIDAKTPQSVTDGSSRGSYSRALRYHGMALSQVRREAGGLQSATLCCLFFVIFEMMSGDERAAMAHMYSGCRMIEELRRSGHGRSAAVASGGGDGGSTEMMLFVELQKAVRFVEMQVRGHMGADVRGLTDG